MEAVVSGDAGSPGFFSDWIVNLRRRDIRRINTEGFFSIIIKRTARWTTERAGFPTSGTTYFEGQQDLDTPDGGLWESAAPTNYQKNTTEGDPGALGDLDV